MIIQTQELVRRFGRYDALNGVNLSVPEGSAFALIGPNGAGKTTAIKVLMNLLQPTSGGAQVLGVDSRRLAPSELARIGYVAESQRLPAQLSSGEYLDYLRPFYASWDTALERSLIDLLQIPLERRIRHLSRGTRMKLALVCALAYRPKLLILDEPFEGLDPLVRDELSQGLLQQASETTILISSHDLAEIETFVTHVAFLVEGRLLLQEPIEQLTSRMREVRVTLDAEAAPPSQVPEHWRQLSASGNVFSFIDTQFSDFDSHARVHAALKGVRRVEVQPLTLRAIFQTLARGERRAGVQP